MGTGFAATGWSQRPAPPGVQRPLLALKVHKQESVLQPQEFLKCVVKGNNGKNILSSPPDGFDAPQKSWVDVHSHFDGLDGVDKSISRESSGHVWRPHRSFSESGSFYVSTRFSRNLFSRETSQRSADPSVERWLGILRISYRHLWKGILDGFSLFKHRGA